MPRKIPPILKTPGLRVIEIGENEHGAYLKFAVDEGDVREVTILMQSNQPVRWAYQYSVYDRTTETVVTYRGRYGDPQRDRRIDLRGV